MDGKKPGPQRNPSLDIRELLFRDSTRLTLAVQLLSHHVVRPMYDATNQENTSLTRTVSALPVIIGRGVGNDGQHMSGGLAAPIYATSISSAATIGANGASSSLASMFPFPSSLAVIGSILAT